MNTQLELNFDITAKRRLSARRQAATNAGWWFARIRQIVDRATEWSPSTATKSCQTNLPWAA